jgi:hypothetical protein
MGWTLSSWLYGRPLAKTMLVGGTGRTADDVHAAVRPSYNADFKVCQYESIRHSKTAEAYGEWQ